MFFYTVYQEWKKKPFLVFFLRLLQSRIFKIAIATILLFLIGGFFLLRYLEYKAFQSRIQVGQIRSFITYVINTDLEKAVDVGIIDFSLWDGILIEDLVISQEEDFTFNTKLLQSKKIALQLSSVFSDQPYIKKVKIIGAKLEVDQNDPFFLKLVDYLLKVNIQEVEIVDAELVILDRNGLALDWKYPTSWTFKKSSNTIHYEFQNGWFWLPFTKRIRGSGTISLGDDSNKLIIFNSEWKGIPVENFPGFTNWVSIFEGNLGSMDGNLNIEVNGEEWKVNSDVDYSDLSGRFSFWDNDAVEGMDLHSEFSSELSGEKKTKLSTHKLSSNWGSLSIELKEEKNLQTGKIQWEEIDIETLHKLVPSWENFKLSGSLDGELSFQETGVRNNWFQFQGRNNWENGNWNQEGWNLEWEKWNTVIQDNQLTSKLNGRIFGSVIDLELNTKLQFWKSTRPNKKNYYPLGTVGSIKGNIATLKFSDWGPLWEIAERKFKKEVKERQEKLLQEEYFTQSEIYRYILEEMNLDWNIKVADVYTGNGKNKLPDWSLQGIVKSGRANVRFNQSNTKNKFEYTTQFGTKTPYMEFIIQAEDLPWNQKVFSVCFVDFIPDSLSLDYRLRTRGADFYTISKESNISSSWKLDSLRLVDPENHIEKKIPWNFLSTNNRINLEFDMDHYFGTSYYRSIYLKMDEVFELRGSGSTRNLRPGFNFYGKVFGENKSLSLEEWENQCK